MNAKLTHESFLPISPERLFELHARPEALRRLSPSFPPVQSIEQTGKFEVGTTVRIRIGVGPIAASWLAVLEEVEPGRRFVDAQKTGPFQSWRHVHEFRPADGGGCLMRDEVAWSSRGALSWLDGSLVAQVLKRYFRKRHEALADWVKEETEARTNHGQENEKK